MAEEVGGEAAAEGAGVASGEATTESAGAVSSSAIGADVGASVATDASIGTELSADLDATLATDTSESVGSSVASDVTKSVLNKTGKSALRRALEAAVEQLATNSLITEGQNLDLPFLQDYMDIMCIKGLSHGLYGLAKWSGKNSVSICGKIYKLTQGSKTEDISDSDIQQGKKIMQDLYSARQKLAEEVKVLQTDLENDKYNKVLQKSLAEKETELSTMDAAIANFAQATAKGMLNDTKLTPEQLAQLQPLAKGYTDFIHSFNAAKDNLAEARALAIQARALSTAESSIPGLQNEIDGISSQIKELQNVKGVARMKNALKIRELITQKKRLIEKLKQLKKNCTNARQNLNQSASNLRHSVAVARANLEKASRVIGVERNKVLGVVDDESGAALHVDSAKPDGEGSSTGENEDTKPPTSNDIKPSPTGTGDNIEETLKSANSQVTYYLEQINSLSTEVPKLSFLKKL